MASLRLRAAVVCTLAAAALVAGCGDDGEEAETQATAPQAPPPATTQPQRTTPERERQAAEPDTADKRRRLEQAGYDDVIASGTARVEPPPKAALEFPLEGGGGVTVFVYDSADDARAVAKQFESNARRYPDYFRVVVKGTTTYLGVAEQPEKLDVDEFDAAVAAAEG